MAAGHFIGIDVVDLREPRCLRKHEDPRFLRRVLAQREREVVAAARDPAGALWRLWAAKEAAFKVVSKIRGVPPPFVHPDFVVASAGATPGFGTVSWSDLTVRIHWHQESERVAALAWNGVADDEAVEWGWGAAAEIDPDPAAPLEALLGRLTERERRPVHSRASVLVRLAARATLARGLDVAEARAQIVCGEGPRGRIPPEAVLDGNAAPVDVSLSHHGRWLAWGIRLSGSG